MKIGTEIGTLAANILRDANAKRDFVSNTRNLVFTSATRSNGGSGIGSLVFKAGESEYQTDVTPLALRQIGERVGIPAKYVEKLSASGNRELLAVNVNHWFQTAPEKRMIRGLIHDDGRQIARAFLSDRYRPLDNADIVNAVVPKLIDAGCVIQSAEVTETRLYIQAATPRLEADIAARKAEAPGEHRVGAINDPVQAGIVISNSEVGCGALKIEPMLYRLVCRNGLIVPDAGVRKHHVGRNNVFAELDNAAEYFTDATRQLDDRAFWAKVNDVVSAVLNKDRFASLIEKFAAAKGEQIGDPVGAVEVVTKRFNLAEGEGRSVLSHLASGGDVSLFGLVNAVTRTAEDAESYDRAIELERMGWDVLELPPAVFAKN